MGAFHISCKPFVFELVKWTQCAQPACTENINNASASNWLEFFISFALIQNIFNNIKNRVAWKTGAVYPLVWESRSLIAFFSLLTINGVRITGSPASIERKG